jgi:thiamine pyrophosphokinase
MNGVIVANGPMLEPPLTTLAARDADLVVCVDGGARHALALGLQPDVVVGDMDSVEPALRKRLQEEGVRLVDFPCRKDETDLELAVRYALREGATDLVLLAALGGRIDHTLANLMLLASPELEDVGVRVIEGNQELFLIRREAVIEGMPGDTVSLLPLAGDASGIYTEGLEYPLQDGVLKFGAARGVSNVLLNSKGRVRLRDGLLLLVHHHREPR